MSKALADALEIWGFEDELTIFGDGSTGFGFELTPIDVSCWDDARLDDLARRTMQFLNGLPPGIDMQLVQDITAGHSARLEHHARLASPGAGNLAKVITADRIDRLRTVDSTGDLPKHTLHAFIRRPLAESLLKKPRLFSKAKQFQEIASARLERELAMTRNLASDLKQGFAGIGLNARVLEQAQVFDLMYAQWNPDRPIGRGRVDSDQVRSSLLFTDVGVNDQGFTSGGVHHRVISLKLLPEQTMSAMASVLGSLPFDSRLLVSIHVPDQQKEIEHLQLQRRLAFSMVNGKRNGVSDIESQAKLDDLERLLGEMVTQGERAFHVGLNVVLKSRDQSELDTQVSQTLAILRELGGAEAMVESLAAFDIFAQSAVPNARTRERRKRIKTSNLADFLPIYGPWEGHDVPSVLLRTKAGGLVGFDPFASSMTNANQIVSGGSGSGKSFLANILLLQMLKEDPQVFIIDIGGSYKKLCDLLGGQYIPMGVSCGMSLNPFDLLPGQTKADNQKIKFLVGLIELMTKEEGDTRLPKLERAEIEQSIAAVYADGAQPKMRDLRNHLLRHEESSIRRFGKILTPWCGDTLYGEFVDRDTNIQLTGPIVCFDLKGLESYPDLQAACLFMITDLVWRVVQQDRSRKKFLIFDECWKLLENDAGAAFIADVFRTFRKYYASAIAISQNIDDFARSKISAAILPNASVKWILMQKGADQGRLKEVLGLNDAEAGLIAGIHQERGVYSEAFLMAQDDRALVAVESTPLEYWIATTDPREVAAINAATNSSPGKTQLEVLQDLATKHPRGLLAQRESRT